MTAHPAPPRSVLEARRRSIHDALDDGVMVLPAAPVQLRSRDTERPYVPDRELFYATGVTEPDSVAVLFGGDEPRFALFVPERDPDLELWGGARLGPEAAAEAFGPTECHPVRDLGDLLAGLLQAGSRIHYRLGRGGLVERLVLEALARGRARGPRSGTGPRGVVDPGEILDELRLRKDEWEIERLHRAAEVSVAGHRAGAAAIAAGVGEWVVEAAIDGTFRREGAAGPGFDTIVGAGANACTLHYVANGATIREGDLVLVDAGAEVDLYHGDMTRTYPASGAFTGPQRDVYDLVEAARARAVSVAAPGVTIAAVHDAAVEVLTAGLRSLGVVRVSDEEAMEEGVVKAFFPHQTSHWLGLDVHDPGDYARGGSARVLEPGMVFTVEPGLYFRQAEGPAAPFAGLGVRIEDTVVMTEGGAEILGPGLPSDAEGVLGLLSD